MLPLFDSHSYVHMLFHMQSQEEAYLSARATTKLAENPGLGAGQGGRQQFLKLPV